MKEDSKHPAPKLSETIKERIRKIRKERGLTQQQLACMMGVSVSVVERYERGLVYIRLERLYLFAKHLGVSPFDLLEQRRTSRQTVEGLLRRLKLSHLDSEKRRISEEIIHLATSSDL